MPPDRTNAHVIGLTVNLGLAVVKLVVGVAVGAQVLVADGMNSTGDVVATAIGWAGFALGRRPADDDHPYGHGAFEAAAGMVIGAMLLLTGVFVSLDGTRALLQGVSEPPGAVAMGVALVTALVKELLYRYTIAEGTRLSSPALLASARDHRADVGMAVTVFAAVAAARLGAPWIDPLAAIGVGLWIAWMGYEPLRTNLGVLLDEAPEGVTGEVEAAARTVDGVVCVDRVRVHSLGSYHVADVRIEVDGTLSLRDAHAIARQVQHVVIASVDDVTEVTAHVQPAASDTTSGACHEGSAGEG